MDFEPLWQQLYDHGASARKEEGTRRYWETLTADQQRVVFTNISNKLKAGKFVQYDPIRAIRENIPKQKAAETLSYADYYARYGTTEEKDGWKMVNPTGRQVVYMKGEWKDFVGR